MKHAVRRAVEIRVRDESGEVISEQALELDIGTGRFAEIEPAVEGLRRQAVKRLEGDLLEREQARFIETAQKGGPGFCADVTGWYSRGYTGGWISKCNRAADHG